MTQLQVDNFHIELHELIDYNCAVCLNAYMVMHEVGDIEKVISNKEFMDFLYIFINRNKSMYKKCVVNCIKKRNLKRVVKSRFHHICARYERLFK